MRYRKRTLPYGLFLFKNFLALFRWVLKIPHFLYAESFFMITAEKKSEIVGNGLDFCFSRLSIFNIQIHELLNYSDNKICPTFAITNSNVVTQAHLCKHDCFSWTFIGPAIYRLPFFRFMPNLCNPCSYCSRREMLSIQVNVFFGGREMGKLWFKSIEW